MKNRLNTSQQRQWFTKASINGSWPSSKIYEYPLIPLPNMQLEWNVTPEIFVYASTIPTALAGFTFEFACRLEFVPDQSFCVFGVANSTIPMGTDTSLGVPPNVTRYMTIVPGANGFELHVYNNGQLQVTPGFQGPTNSGDVLTITNKQGPLAYKINNNEFTLLPAFDAQTFIVLALIGAVNFKLKVLP